MKRQSNILNVKNLIFMTFSELHRDSHKELDHCNSLFNIKKDFIWASKQIFLSFLACHSCHIYKHLS